MTSPDSSRALIAIGGLVAAVIAAGLWTTGGPLTGRMERRDEVRLNDLQAMIWAVRCMADDQDGVLPETYAHTDHCRSDRATTDPFDGTAYAYAVTSPTSFELCANFERPDRIGSLGFAIYDSVDTERGCIVIRYRPDLRLTNP